MKNTVSAPHISFKRGLKGFVKFRLIFETLSGLLIRMPVQAQAYRIGGADQYPMVTKKEYNGREIEVPYVPGSSLKGRMRCLLELSMGSKVYTTDKKIWQHVRNISAMDEDFFSDVINRCVIDELFGWAATNYRQISDKLDKLRHKLGSSITADDVYKILAPTRLLVTDFFPSSRYVAKIDAKSVADFLEEKSENRIDRITSAADPRNVVRVKPGVEFEGSITIILYDHDKDMVSKYIHTLATGLKLIEETYLGGSGSRGYGRVKFKNIRVSVSKIECQDNVVKLVDTEIIREYSSVNDLMENVEALAKEIVEKVFS